MKSDRSLKNQFRYGKVLVESGVSGLRRGRDSHLRGQSLSTVLSQSARASVGMATLGATAALLKLYLNNRRSRLPKALAVGAIGSAVGFVAGLAWETRGLTSGMSRSALKQIGAARDEHWLQRHPVNYA
jgi:hypothetical protein